MAQLQFERVDLQVFLRHTEDGGVVVRIGQPGSYFGRSFTPDQAADSTYLTGSLLDLLRGSPFFSYTDWLERGANSAQSGRREIILRLVLDIQEPGLASLPWEQVFSSLFGGFADRTVVRLSAMRPRWAGTPFAVPLRILNINPVSGGASPGLLRQLIGYARTDEIAAQAVTVHECDFAELVSFHTPANWPSAEVLHFGSLPSLSDADTLLRPSLTDQPGTLGWFARVSDLWQTRLIVIECNTEVEAAAARRLAAALVNRAGPAVLVCEQLPDANQFFGDFYWNLLHDFPLDYAVPKALSNVGSVPDRFPLSLFAGAGREEGLRISSLGLALLKIEEELAATMAQVEVKGAGAVDDLMHLTTAHLMEVDAEPLTYDLAGNIVISAVKSMTRGEIVQEDLSLRLNGIHSSKQLAKLGTLINTYYPEKEIAYEGIVGTGEQLGLQADWTVRDVIDKLVSVGMFLPRGTTRAVEERSRLLLAKVGGTLAQLKAEWPSYHFEEHESSGYIPVTEKVSELREHLDFLEPLSYRSHIKLTVPRHINASLWSSDDENEALKQLGQNSSLTVGEVYQLGIQIGPKDIRIRTFGETALFEEVFNWSPDMEGVWIEFAITGLDFEVLGDPVRELWLPRDGPTEMIYFAVSPPRAGACRLRYCLYYQQNIVQSFRLAAIACEPEEEVLAEVRQRLLSKALDLRPEVIGDAAYFTRLEYSLTSSMESLESRPPRQLSIVANDLDGKPVVSIKSSDEFDVSVSSDLSDSINDVRKAMMAASANELSTEKDPLKWPYAFGAYASQPETLAAALMKLAEVGWRLYDKVFRESAKKKLEKELSKDGEIIHVAHILLDKVIPWAALYDIQYKPDVHEDAELRQIEHAACLAALPDAAGKFPTLECGTHPECLLHADQAKKREAEGKLGLLRETVACPLHFWGFKHIIEIPPQQVSSEGTTPPQRDLILSENGVQMIAGMNAHLRLWLSHAKNLKKFSWKSQASRLAIFNKALQDAELDLIYLYCHAGGGRTDPAGYDPYLLFQDTAQKSPEKMRSADFPRDPQWAHHPLVFLNGCGTVGFSPDALSPFIEKLVEDLGAAGVIGTEITVWEELATEVAESFLNNFLGGSEAGKALLDVRRSLLAKKNPLGLVYTLYAPAHLKLKQNAGVDYTVPS